MTPQQYQRVQDVFLRLRTLQAGDRAAQLALEDDAIAREVASLLESESSCGDFLERRDSDVGATQALVSMAPGVPETVGSYRLLQLIGEGGYGTVYLAEQTEPIDRKVAVKLIKPGMDSKQVLARFHAERQALAMMDHPSIARVIDAGTTDRGLPYFVMELVKGIPIHDFCETNCLNLEERLSLFLQVCGAVHHAHQKGVIHRDLKPSNVLVTMGEGEPIAKVIDFGIAKALDTRLTQQTLFTEYGQMIGTLEYMSPEQAEMSVVDIDTRSDVYSLGVLLYQLLTGETPISKDELLDKGLFEIPRLIRETEPLGPSSRITTRQQQRSQVDRTVPKRGLSSLQRGDLDSIAMKALAKDRRRRYDSALDFARDIRRFLNGDPVDAHPPSMGYRLGKFASRHRVVAVTGLLIICSMLLGILGLATGLRRANIALVQSKADRSVAIAAQQQADRSARLLAENLYSEVLQSAWRAANAYDSRRALKLFDACLPELRGWEWHFAKSQVRDQTHDVIRSAGESAIVDIDLSRSNQLAACVLDNGKVEIWDLKAGQLAHTVSEEFEVNAARFNPDASTLIVGTTKGALMTLRSSDWKPTRSKPLGLGGIYGIDVSRSGQYVAVCTGGRYVQALDLPALNEVSKWQLPARAGSVSFATRNDQLVASGLDGNVYGLRLGTPEIESSFVSETSLQHASWVGPHTVATLSAGSAVSIDTLDFNNAPVPIVRCRGVASALAADTQGAIFVGCGDGSLIVKRTDTDQRTVANCGTAISAISTTNRDQRLLIALSDGRLLGVGTDESFSGWLAPAKVPISAGILLPSHKLAVLFDEDGWMQVFDIDSGTQVSKHRAHKQSVWSVSSDQNERLLATVGQDQQLRCWELPSFKLRFERAIDWGVRDVCVSSNGSWIAAAPPQGKRLGQREGRIGIWNSESGECERLLEGHDNWVLKLAVTADDAKLVSASEDRSARVWDPSSGETIQVIAPRRQSAPEHIAFSHPATTVYLGHRDGWVTAWSVDEAKPGPQWPAFGDSLSGLAVTHDNRVVATSRSSEQIRIRDFATQRTVGDFDFGHGYLLSFRLSRDEQYISIANQDRRVLTTRIGAPSSDRDGARVEARPPSL